MSRTTLPLVCLILTTLAYLPPIAAQTNDGPIAVYSGHPQFAQKQNYASRAEWPLFSAQTHWCENSPLMPSCQATPKVPAHGHVDCKLPLYGVIQRADLTVRCTLRAFHLPGNVMRAFTYGIDGSTVTYLNGPPPYAGEPAGLVEKDIEVTFAGNAMRTDNGVQRLNVSGEFHIATGSGFYTYNEFIVYVVADPSLPMPTGLTGADFVTTSHVPVGGSGSGKPGNQGNPTVDFPSWLPIAPLTAPFDIVARGQSYQLEEDGRTFPGSGFMEQRLSPNLHADVPGTVLQRKDIAGIDLFKHEAMSLRLDPAVLGPGHHKIMTRWFHTTGPGNARFAAGETFEALATFDVVVGGSVPTPTDPVPCGGVWGWAFTDAGLVRTFMRVFTVSTSSPANCIRPTVPQ